MQLVDDKDSIRATKAIGSPPRRKPPPKKTIEEEAADVIMAELKEVFMKDVRSRIVTPTLFDLLDPSHYKDIQPKSVSSVSPVKVLRPDPRISVATSSPVKRETSEVPMNRRAINNLLPRFRKKGTEPAKVDSVRDRKPTKADVRPMHHQFNHYSDSEEDELPQREQSVMTDDEDDSSRPSREATTVSTPEPTRPKEILKSHLNVTDVPFVKGDDSEEELLKDILDTTKDEVHRPLSKRKRVIDFTSSEDEDEPTPPKKVCVELEVSDVMQVDEPVTPKLSKAALHKIAKAKAAALQRAKRAELKAQEVEDSIVIETIPEKEVKVPTPAKQKVAEVNLAEIEGDDDMLLDLDGVQTLVRDREDYRYLLQAVSHDTPEPIRDIWTWSWTQKKLKALNFDGAQGTFPKTPISPVGPMKIPEPPAYNRINPSGSARTEGYVKIPEAEKSLYLPQRNKAIIPIGSEAARKTSRMNRVNNRRLAADMEVQKKTLSTESDILRFNQLKARKKQLKFARSPIHDWGLFAMEDIEAHEMVIEYVGEIIRFQIAELREKQYERIGIGSSYLFRVDDENIIDGKSCYDLC
jgi:[histone H3]-lysine4 N-trimethyltransferase SETD1